MKLSRNKISKLIKKKKHSRSKNHKKRDDHTVVFSKSKDYDKPITRKKGGWKGYHAPHKPDCKRRSMKRVYRGGADKGNADQGKGKGNKKKTKETNPTNNKVPKAVVATKVIEAECASFPKLPSEPFSTWDEAGDALENMDFKLNYCLDGRKEFMEELLNRLPEKDKDNNNVKQKIMKFIKDGSALNSPTWYEIFTNTMGITDRQHDIETCNMKLNELAKNSSVKDKDVLQGLKEMQDLFDNCYAKLGGDELKVLWKNSSYKFLSRIKEAEIVKKDNRLVTTIGLLIDQLKPKAIFVEDKVKELLLSIDIIKELIEEENIEGNIEGVNETDSDDNILYHDAQSKDDMQNKKKEVEKVALEAAALSDSTPTTTSVQTDPVPTPDTAISANDLQTMQQKSADALKSAQDHHAKVQDLVKANPLATLTADTYNFDDCTADMSMAKKEIVGPNPEYRKAQPKCKPFIDKTMTERKQWVDGMKNAVTLENPSEKCATFSDSESKKIDDYAKKCAKQENQVVVNITEAPINDTHKRMNITVFAPNKSEVVLQDYAHSTYEQTMHNFEDLKMDGELDLSGLTNAASAAKDAVKKAASATITAAKSAATTAASATKQAASKAKEAVTGTGTGTTRATPDATATPDAPDAPDATATPAGPGIIGKIKNYLKKGQIQEMRETMDNLQDVSDQLSDSMTPSQAEKQEDLVEEINSLIKALSRNDTAAVTQVGGDQGDVDRARVSYDEAKNEADSIYNSGIPDAVNNLPNAIVNQETTARALSDATLHHANQVNSDTTSYLPQKVDAANQHMVAAETHLSAANQRVTNAKTILNEKNDEFNTAQRRNTAATIEDLASGVGDDFNNAENAKNLAEEELKNAETIQKAASETKEESEKKHTQLKNELNTEHAKREASNIHEISQNIYDNSTNSQGKLIQNEIDKEHTQKYLTAAKENLKTASGIKKQVAEQHLSLAKSMHSKATGKGSELIKSKALDNIGNSAFVNQGLLEESVGNAVAANKEHINATYDNEKSSSADKLKADENHASFLKNVRSTDKGKSLGFEDEMNEAQKNVEDAKTVVDAEKVHKKTKIALATAKAKLENVKVSSDSTKNIVATAEARNEFDNALTKHTEATERLNEAQEKRGCGDKSAGEDCKKKLQDDEVKRADEVNKLSKSESDDGKALLDVANTKVSEMKVSKRQQDITNLLDTYEIILNKLRKMNGGPGAKKGNIMVSQSVLDNMNSLLDKMISQQEIIVKALGKITPENDKFTNQSKEVSGFLFKGVKEYVASNVSVPDTVIKNGIENINTKLVEYKDKIKKDVLSKDARNFSKAVIDSAIAANEPIKSVNNRVTIWREIMKYIRTDVLKLNPIEELDLLAQDLSNLLKTIKDTPMSNEDQTKIVKIIKEINSFLYSKPFFKNVWDSIWTFVEMFTLDQIDINQQNKDKEKTKYFTTLSGDKPKEYDEKVKQFESKLIDIKEKLETLEQEMEYSGPSQTEITDTNATTIYSILEKIKDQASNSILSANVIDNTRNQIVNTLGEVTRIKTDFLFTGDNENDDLKNLLTKLSNNDKNKLFDKQTIPIEEKDKAIYDTSIKNIIESWNNALSEINKIIKSNSKPQTGGKNRHSKKSKKRKSKSNLKSKSSRVKLTRKSSKK